jgi:hypothetical protein
MYVNDYVYLTAGVGTLMAVLTAPLAPPIAMPSLKELMTLGMHYLEL